LNDGDSNDGSSSVCGSGLPDPSRSMGTGSTLSDGAAEVGVATLAEVVDAPRPVEPAVVRDVVRAVDGAPALVWATVAGASSVEGAALA